MLVHDLLVEPQKGEAVCAFRTVLGIFRRPCKSFLSMVEAVSGRVASDKRAPERVTHVAPRGNGGEASLR